MRLRAALAVSLLVAAVGGPGVVFAPDAAADGCAVKPGLSSVPDLWPQKRLDYTRTWTRTRGVNVRVAVIDSGLNTVYDPQLKGVRVAPGINVIGAVSTSASQDCVGHGSEVTSIIAAQPGSNNFSGVAPDVTIIPIKWTDTDGGANGGQAGLVRGIDAAIAANASVINMSLTSTLDSPDLRAAVARAAARGIVIVAAAGNDGGNANQLPAYPAAYSTSFPNVIAVSASDTNDVIAQFSDTGSYVTVAAPGVNVPSISGRGGYVSATGTSFAAPYVTGTVALIQSAYRGIDPVSVRSRIVSTADSPPASVPDRSYGYGIIDPFLAVTTLSSGAPSSSAGRTDTRLPALAAVTPADHHTRNVALGSAAALLGLAALALAASTVLRRRRRDPVHVG